MVRLVKKKGGREVGFSVHFFKRRNNFSNKISRQIRAEVLPLPLYWYSYGTSSTTTKKISNLTDWHTQGGMVCEFMFEVWMIGKQDTRDTKTSHKFLGLSPHQCGLHAWVRFLHSGTLTSQATVPWCKPGIQAYTSREPMRRSCIPAKHFDHYQW